MTQEAIDLFEAICVMYRSFLDKEGKLAFQRTISPSDPNDNQDRFRELREEGYLIACAARAWKLTQKGIDYVMTTVSPPIMHKAKIGFVLN